MDFPPKNPRDIDFTEVEAILRVHEHLPFGARVEVVMGHVHGADFLIGWQEGGIANA